MSFLTATQSLGTSIAPTKEENVQASSPVPQSSRQEELHEAINLANLPPSCSKLSPKKIEVATENPMGNFSPFLAPSEEPREIKSREEPPISTASASFNPPKLDWSAQIYRQARESLDNMDCKDWKIKGFVLPEKLKYTKDVCVPFSCADKDKKHLYIPIEHPLKDIADLLCAVESEIQKTGRIPDEALELLIEAVKCFRKSIPSLLVMQKSDNAKLTEADRLGEIKQVLGLFDVNYNLIYQKKDYEENQGDFYLILMDELVELSNKVYELFFNYFEGMNVKKEVFQNDIAPHLEDIFYIQINKAYYNLKKSSISEIEKLLFSINKIKGFKNVNLLKGLLVHYLNFYYNHDKAEDVIQDIKYFELLLSNEYKNSNFKTKKTHKNNQLDCTGNDSTINIKLCINYIFSILEIAINENRSSVHELFYLSKCFFDSFQEVFKRSPDEQKKMMINTNYNEYLNEFNALSEKYKTLLIKKQGELKSVLITMFGKYVESIEIDENQLVVACKSLEQRNHLLVFVEEKKLTGTSQGAQKIAFQINEILANLDSTLESFESISTSWIYSENRQQWEDNLKRKYKQGLSHSKMIFKLKEKSTFLDINISHMTRRDRSSLFQFLNPLLGEEKSQISTEFSVKIEIEELMEKNGNSLFFLEQVSYFLNQKNVSSGNKQSAASTKKVTRKRRAAPSNPEEAEMSFVSPYPRLPTKEPRNPDSIRRKSDLVSAGTQQGFSGEKKEPKKIKIDWASSGRFYEEKEKESVRRLNHPHCPETFYGYIQEDLLCQKEDLEKFESVLCEGRYKQKGRGIKMVKLSERKKHGLPKGYTLKLKIKGDQRIYGREEEVTDFQGNKKVLVVFDTLIRKTHFKAGL